MVDRRGRVSLILIVLLQFCLALLDLAGVVVLGVVVAVLVGGGQSTQSLMLLPPWAQTWVPTADVISLLVAVAVLFLTKSIASFLAMTAAYRFLSKKQIAASHALAGELLARPLVDMRLRTTQETSYALTQGVSAAVIGVLGNVIVMASELAVLVTLGVGLLLISPGVAVFTLAFFGVAGALVFRFVGLWGHRSGAILSQVEIHSTESVQNLLHTYREYIVSGRRGLFLQAFGIQRTTAAKHQANMQILGQLTKYVFELVLIVGAGLLATLLFTTSDPAKAAATLVVFLAATSRISPALLRFQQAALTYRAACGMAEPALRLWTDFRFKVGARNHDFVMIQSHRAQGNPHESWGPVLVNEVSFTYPEATLSAIADVSLVVPPGTSLALVGPSGAGKSTLVDLILGILEPDEGSVHIDGRSPAAIAASEPGALAYVPQDVTLIRGSIRENVALGIPGDAIDDSSVWEALERAQLSDVVLRAGGTHTQVGERGVNFSGGQRQRLGLARALYSSPRLLVLDEATSALDADTESAVTRALERLPQGVSVIVVAHRLATVRNCDQVAYLESGRLMAVGAFDEVRSAVPQFDRQAGLLGL